MIKHNPYLYCSFSGKSFTHRVFERFYYFLIVETLFVDTLVYNLFNFIKPIIFTKPDINPGII